jgi:excinuclease ABC subunit C
MDVDALFPHTAFVDFGPCELMPGQAPPGVVRIDAINTRRLKAQVRLLGPSKPGVYGMLDRHGTLMYVGKAKDLRTRLLSYFRPKSRAAKATKIVREAGSIVWESCACEFAALLRELELIRRWRPRWNVQGQPLRRRQTFLCVGRAPAPHVYLSNRPPRDDSSIHGPIPAGPLAKQAAATLNDLFGLRDCPSPQEMLFPEQRELFPLVRPPACLRMEIGSCLGPCTGTCPQPAYDARVREARRFLLGLDDARMEQIERDMHAAAAAQQFERAARLRDVWKTLDWLASKLHRLREAQAKLSFIYPRRGRWYLVHGARVLQCLHVPRDTAQAEAALTCIQRCFDTLAVRHLDGYEHADGMVVVMSWFRKHPHELTRTLSPQDARTLLRARFPTAYTSSLES